VTSAGTLLQRLTTHQTGEEEQVHGHGDHLYTAIQVAIQVHGHGDHLYTAIDASQCVWGLTAI